MDRTRGKRELCSNTSFAAGGALRAKLSMAFTPEDIAATARAAIAHEIM